jgi:hypothetical protein
MEQNVSKISLLSGLFILIGAMAFAQSKLVDNKQTKMLFENMGQELFAPEPPDSICSLYSTITLQVRNHKLSEQVDFSRDLPQPFRDEFNKVVHLYRETDWTKVIGTGGANYDIYQPFVYYYFDTAVCPDTITGRQIKAKLKEDIAKQVAKVPGYQLLPIKLRAYPVVH